MKYLGSMNMAEWTIAFSIVYTFIAVGGKKKSIETLGLLGLVFIGGLAFIAFWLSYSSA